MPSIEWSGWNPTQFSELKEDLMGIRFVLLNTLPLKKGNRSFALSENHVRNTQRYWKH